MLLTLVEAVGGRCWPSDDKLENWTETSSPCRHLQVTSWTSLETGAWQSWKYNNQKIFQSNPYSYCFSNMLVNASFFWDTLYINAMSTFWVDGAPVAADWGSDQMTWLGSQWLPSWQGPAACPCPQLPRMSGSRTHWWPSLPRVLSVCSQISDLSTGAADMTQTQTPEPVCWSWNKVNCVTLSYYGKRVSECSHVIGI